MKFGKRLKSHRLQATLQTIDFMPLSKPRRKTRTSRESIAGNRRDDIGGVGSGSVRRLEMPKCLVSAGRRAEPPPTNPSGDGAGWEWCRRRLRPSIGDSAAASSRHRAATTFIMPRRYGNRKFSTNPFSPFSKVRLIKREDLLR